MITLRKSCQRGYADHGWLKSFHSFSFANYHDPEHMGFGNLRVINEDRIAPGTGFGTHAHRDMEILSVVLSGELAHRDNLGNGTAIRPGEVQRMSAGRGVQHSEFNHAPQDVTHFLQVWLQPKASGIPPSYEQKAFDAKDQRGRLQRVAAPEHQDGGAVVLHADASVYLGDFDGAESAQLPLAPGRLGYVHVIEGSVHVNGLSLGTGDAAKLVDESELTLDHALAAKVMVFDLAANGPH
jgi:quercetin 2,3-dioxygenase